MYAVTIEYLEPSTQHIDKSRICGLFALLNFSVILSNQIQSI